MSYLFVFLLPFLCFTYYVAWSSLTYLEFSLFLRDVLVCIGFVFYNTIPDVSNVAHL